MQDRHTNRLQYFNEQSKTSENHVLPFIKTVIKVTTETDVLEIGCGEGGNLKPFVDMGCRVIGIDLAKSKIENGRKFYEGHPNNNNLQLIASDIYKIESGEPFLFDVILLRDTFEHIPDQGYFLSFVKRFMKPGAVMFLGFPPWRMPFGGHQQMCRNRLASKLPYIHLLPLPVYKGLLKAFGESEQVIYELLEVRDTRVYMKRFKGWLKEHNYYMKKECFFLINPNYEAKFGLKSRPLPRLLNIPILRDFLATTYYCILTPKSG